MLIRLNNAIDDAHKWLRSTYVRSQQAIALQQLGLLICDNIRLCNDGFTEIRNQFVDLPEVISLVNMSRTKILTITQDISLSTQKTWKLNKYEREIWAQIMGGLAVSYARSGDVTVVAALVRAAARMHLQGNWLNIALNYLLDQQQPDGSFGLLTQEQKLLDDNSKDTEVLLRLTVEVIWALVEVVENYNVKSTTS